MKDPILAIPLSYEGLNAQHVYLKKVYITHNFIGTFNSLCSQMIIDQYRPYLPICILYQRILF